MGTSAKKTELDQLNHSGWMQRAISLARRGAGFVESNPMVGSVLVKNGVVLAEGYHAKFGGTHAERRALTLALKKHTPNDLKTATLYITLEPCSHTGKTPPCLDFVIKSGVKQVVIGSVDPNPIEQGRSIRALRKAGIKVDVGILKADCDYLIRTFAKYITTKQPYVLAKVGMSLDGKITTVAPQKYITNSVSLERVHELRQEFAAIMVGVNTIVHDNPRLDTRLKRAHLHHPIKVILDSRLRTPVNSRALDDHTIIACLDSAPFNRKRALARTGAEIIEVPANTKPGKQLFDQMDSNALLILLGQRGISSVLVEGGSYLFTTFTNERAIDEYYIFLAPQLYGATHLPFTYALQYTVTLRQPICEVLQVAGEDTNFLLRGYASYR